MLLHSCLLSVNACKSPISLSGIAQNPRVLSTHYWFWTAFPPAAICTHFFNSCLHLCFSQNQFQFHCPPFYEKEHQEPVSAQFLSPRETHWACASCTVSRSPSTILTTQDNTVQCTVVFPQHTKLPQQYFSSIGTSTPCSRSIIMLFHNAKSKQQIPQMHCNGTIFLSKTSQHGATHSPRMQISSSHCRIVLCFT